ncbi:MAG: hypothetical protein ACREO8_06575 [Luteimonas sp.]
MTKLTEEKGASQSGGKAANDGVEGKITTLAQVDVLIFRNDTTSIPDTVFEHELPILRMLHGDAFVKVAGEDTVDVEDFDANDELERLKRKYISKDADPVSAVYRNDPRLLAKEAGVTYEAGTSRKPPASEQTPAKKTVLRKQR